MRSDSTTKNEYSPAQWEWARALYQNGFTFPEISQLSGIKETTLRSTSAKGREDWKAKFNRVQIQPEDSLRLMLALFLQNLRKAILSSAQDDFLETLPAYLSNLERIAKTVTNWAQTMPLIGLKAEIEFLKKYAQKAEIAGNNEVRYFLLCEIKTLSQQALELIE